MTDPDKRINDEWTVGELEETFEGKEHVPHVSVRDKDHVVCDFCSAGIPYSSNPRVAFYVADRVLNPDHPVYQQAQLTREEDKPLVPLAIYCEECSHSRLFFPCEGFAEVRLFFDLTEDRMMENVKVADLSPRDDGIPWDPKELSERVSQVPWDQQMVMQAAEGEDQLWGPENMITFFMAFVRGVDPRELIQYDGTLDPKTLGRARKSYETFVKKMQRGGDYDRKKFRDYVQGDE